MAQDLRTIKVSDETALAHVLAEADKTPLRLEKDGVVYRVSREDAAAYRDDRGAAVAAAVDATAGSWSDLDTDAVIDYIYRGREEGTRPASRP